MHSLRTKSSTASWAKIRNFLNKCFLISEPLMARLDVQKPLASPKMDSLVDHFRQTFGSPINGQDSATTYLNWFLDDDQLLQALSAIDSCEEIFVDNYGRQLVRVIVKVTQPRLTDAAGGILAYQGGDHYLEFEGEPDRILGECYLDAELGKNNFFYGFLSLPFDELNTAFREYADFIKTNFPCSMSRSSWKCWWLTKSGRSYVGRKLRLSQSTDGTA